VHHLRVAQDKDAVSCSNSRVTVCRDSNRPLRCRNKVSAEDMYHSFHLMATSGQCYQSGGNCSHSPWASPLPSSTSQWEVRLVEHFLRIREDGDASPIRSFEVTAETLAIASGVEGVIPEEAESAFKEALCADKYIWSALRDGDCRSASSRVPNCFAYLAMTLLIDTLLDGEYTDKGQFRDRLRTWLGTSLKLANLSGIATMWVKLSLWLDEKAEMGEPFRRISLPPTGAWTQIGHTRHLSFPTRADMRFLDEVLNRYINGPSDPPSLVRAIEAEIVCRKPSWGMLTAFEEFRRLFRAGAASADHRFWRLVLRSAQAKTQTEYAEAVVEIAFDEDGCELILLGSEDENVGLNVVRDLGAAMRSNIVIGSTNLALSANRGFVFFRQVGIARWRAISNLQPSVANVMYLGVSVSAARGHTPVTASDSLRRSGDWYLSSKPIGLQRIDELLRFLQLRRPRAELLLDLSLVGGVRVAGAFLGRKSFLPSLGAGNRCIDVFRLAGQDKGAEITVRDGALVSQSTVEGSYQIDVRSNEQISIPEWSRRIKFVPDALPHLELGEAAYREPRVYEWLPCESGASCSVQLDGLAWSEEALLSVDLLEALYAIASSGRSEAEIFEIVARGADDTRTDPWSLLRSIQESGFLEARKRSGWRGRIWTLGQLSLVPLQGPSEMVVVKGALCAALEREFREVVIALGGMPFRRLGISPWSPAVIGATEVDLRSLSSRLGWQVTPPAEIRRPILRTDPLETSAMLAEDYELASSWDWSRRHFVRGSVGGCDVSLTRWVHPTGRDHDVYRVMSSEHSSSHMTRNAAILTAHILSGTPLFQAVGNTLIRTSKEGALPLEFAEWFRLSELSGGGVLEGQGYGYPIQRRHFAEIAQALPGCVEGIVHDDSPRTREEILMAARRSGGRTRLVWVDRKIGVKK
jgi:hypothetical protein